MRRAVEGLLRVSSRSKCWIQTAPVGSDHAPSGEKPNVPVASGSANQRRVFAWSDQEGAFGSYAITPGPGVRVATLVNAPVADNVAGNCAPPVPEETSRLMAFSARSA